MIAHSIFNHGSTQRKAPVLLLWVFFTIAIWEEPYSNVLRNWFTLRDDCFD
jgi:hypothetical protein